ncbi:MAG: DUF1576 domain-containing protein [Burkholderiales bacterium]|nr:DUF1576 domain-containing protein [Burkholderiales bacterium]
MALAGFGPTLANMGASGAIAMAYILLVGGHLNGPVIGAIFTIVGFAAFGKHPRNIVPIMAGVFLGSLAKPWSADDPSILLAALFGTTLAPIAGRFGWHWGHRRRVRAFVGGAHRRAGTCRPQPLQQRLCRRHRRLGPGSGHHRHPGGDKGGRRNGGRRDGEGQVGSRAVRDRTQSGH